MFELKWAKTPFKSVFVVCASLVYCEGLQKDSTREVMIQGTEMLKANTSKLMRICASVQGETAASSS